MVGGNTNFEVVGSGAGTTHQTGISINVCSIPQQLVPNRLRARFQQLGVQHEILPTTAIPTRDDDGGQIQIIPTKEALAEARQHGGEPICSPRQFDIFLGSGWGDSANDQIKSALARVSASLRVPTICPAAARAQSVPVIKKELDSIRNISDLHIQTRLAKMLANHHLQAPTANSIYIVFLAPAIYSSVGGRDGGRDYLAYHSHFHSTEGEIRYVVVPYDSDRQREEHTVARVVLNMLVNPDGLIW
jgi:hypothetical protein